MFARRLCALLLSSFLISSVAWAASEVVVDVPYAVRLVDQYSNGGKEGKALALEALSKLGDEDLRTLAELIRKDMKEETGQIVVNLRSERLIAEGLLNRIDDKLGSLKYDMVVEGKFKSYVMGGSGVNYYEFIMTEGISLEVCDSVSTLKPFDGYSINYSDTVRLFIDVWKVDGDFTVNYISKIEQLPPPHSK